ncbi:MAG TPA: 6-phosphogluconolactonase [Xanthomonadaceae bacterium]|nr:6-phosphogluconolactonase [Xanthomonadaceae bacterium]
MSWTETAHADASALAQALAAGLGDTISHAIEARGHAVLALAGGRTPFPIYRLLAALSLPWHKVTLLCTDERWVPADHPARNERELAAAFTSARGVRILPLVPSLPGDDAGTHIAESSLAQVTDAFDAVLLGMGGDGHTASLFPGAPELGVALEPHAAPVIELHPDPLPAEAPFPRISLTLPRLLNTRRLLLVLQGEGKREVLHHAQAAADPVALPVAAFLHHPKAKVEIHWSP